MAFATALPVVAQQQDQTAGQAQEERYEKVSMSSIEGKGCTVK